MSSKFECFVRVLMLAETPILANIFIPTQFSCFARRVARKIASSWSYVVSLLAFIDFRGRRKCYKFPVEPMCNIKESDWLWGALLTPACVLVCVRAELGMTPRVWRGSGRLWKTVVAQCKQVILSCDNFQFTIRVKDVCRLYRIARRFRNCVRKR